MTLVVDASVAIKWLLPEIFADHAARLLDGGGRLAAPDFLLVEFGNVVWKKVRRGEVTSSDAEAALQRLGAGPVNLTPTRPLVGPALRLACQLDHPVYDCIYLAAAEALDAVVVTADRAAVRPHPRHPLGRPAAMAGRLGRLTRTLGGRRTPAVSSA